MISPAVITLIVLVAAAVLFISEKIPVPLTAMLCLAVLVLTGIVTPADAIAGFSNSTVILLISMILVGGALFETGVTEKVAKAALKVAKTEKQMIMVVFWLGVALSALLNNTGVMAMMIPLLLGLQASVGRTARPPRTAASSTPRRRSPPPCGSRSHPWWSSPWFSWVCVSPARSAFPCT